MKTKINNFIVSIMFVAAICIFAINFHDSTDTIKAYLNKTEFKLSSSAFKDGETIPPKYVCTKISEGKNISIPLQWTGAPSETKSYAIIMYDLHPVANNFVHWAVINIPSDNTKLDEGISLTKDMPNGSIELKNTSGNNGYIGPCPPKGTGKHEYKTIVFALDVDKINISKDASLDEFQSTIKDNIIQQAELSGYFEQ